jgi:hypothetical protein
LAFEEGVVFPAWGAITDDDTLVKSTRPAFDEFLGLDVESVSCSGRVVSAAVEKFEAAPICNGIAKFGEAESAEVSVKLEKGGTTPSLETFLTLELFERFALCAERIPAVIETFAVAPRDNGVFS